MTRQRVADRGTECQVPLRCLLLDTDDFLETGRYSRVKAELRDNVEFCCDRWLVIIADKWDVELSIIDVCVLCLVMKILRIVALPCVHVHENRVWTIIIWLTRPLWSAARPTLTTKPRIENIESSIETWLKNGVRLSGLAGICCSLWLEFVLVTVCCRRRHWAAFTFNCKLLVLASSSFVLGTLGGLWTRHSWIK